MAAITSHRDLRVWQMAMQLSVDCYALTKSFPKDELFGITSQIRRASVSVPANIAEGYGRESSGAYAQFLRTAQGSLKELETHLELSVRLGLVMSASVEPVLAQADDIGRMLCSLIRSIQPR